MTARPGFRFATDAQWRTCLFLQAERDAPGAGLRPLAPYARPATRHGPPAAYAPAANRFGEVMWRDDAGRLYRMARRDDEPESFAAPRAIARARRIVVYAHGIWVTGDPPESLHRYADDTLTRLSTIELAGPPVADIAGDRQDRVFALLEREGAWRVIPIACAGTVGEAVTLNGISDAKAFVYLKRFDAFVVLAGAHPRLYWFAARGGDPLFSILVAAMRPCFSASALGSDGRGRVFLAGADGQDFGGRPYVVQFDGDGNPLGDLPLDEPATGIAAMRDQLWVTTAAGLLWFSVADTVPTDGGAVETTVITPVLQAPDREDQRRWLRVEASASLPPGATLAISHAVTDDRTERDRLAAIVTDPAVPASLRARRLLAEPDFWGPPVTFQGGEGGAEGVAAPFSAPLFDVRERYVWVKVTLTAGPGARLPALRELAVLYPGRSLMESLPAIYQRDESRPGSFLRSLVGVLESTTQDLDDRIAALGSHAHPATAEPAWLDFIARWLGVPWDDALEVDAKRRILAHAADLARGRGTRVGLETLLESVMPGPPRRFRVSDATADFGFATVGGGACQGSALPAMLGGLTRWSPMLDASAVLDFVRLPCPDQRDDGAWQLTGRIRVDVAASGTERRAWEPWLRALIQDMAPLSTRVQLSWVTAEALRGDTLDDTLVLEGPPAPHLGTDAVTGRTRLPDAGSRLSATGPDIGIRLH